MTPPPQYTSTQYATTLHPKTTPTPEPQFNAWASLIEILTRGFIYSTILTTVLYVTGLIYTPRAILLASSIFGGWVMVVFARTMAAVGGITRSRGAAHASRRRPTL